MSERKDLEGRIALVTGANTGIGRVTAVTLARRGARVYMAGRTEERMKPALDEIRTFGGDAIFLPLELGDLASVRAAAKRFLETGDPLHILVNNAGLAGSPGITKDGFEHLFGVNHIGHFLFTELLLDRLKSSAPSRIVIVASQAHYRAKGIDWDALTKPSRSTTTLPEYGVSKLANVLHAKELARRLEGTGVTTYSLHPGVIASDIWRKVPWPIRPIAMLFMKSVEEGAATSIYCATAPELAAHSGRYYDNEKEKEPARLSKDEALQDELYRRSVAWTDEKSAAGKREHPGAAP